MRQGATTIWERWDGWTEHAGFQSAEMNSFNHYSLGSVGEWVYRYAAGIDQEPDSVAYERLRIAPQLGGRLTKLAARYETPRGTVATRWEIRDGGAEFALTVPPGATARVTLPSVQVREGDAQLAERTNEVAISHGESTFTVTAGDYTFHFPFEGAATAAA